MNATLPNDLLPTKVDPSDEKAVLALFEGLALSAGRAAMDIFAAGFIHETKADASPVTEADRAAERVILEGLRIALAGVTCVAEEEVAAGVVPVLEGDAILLIDPLDGTREFINRQKDFTVNIALVRNGSPEMGVVYAPARSVLYSGRSGEATEVSISRDFLPAARRKISVRSAAKPLTIVASRSHRTPETDEFIARFEGAEIVSVGSSLKFCLLASGAADLYPRFGRTMEWDTAAGDAILRAAGGMTRTTDGRPLRYGKRGQRDEADFANPWFIADASPAATDQRLR
ncbi:3'(2'),5'-bisphosphate nucleotidase CysQ [Allomesorhizobium camelthorni]|uniref:3'(2'),5'-bisphosphate nucleotidase CysQ n=1 Tax=Allomesorhizobium camelthorni TaxID=475069 RepID=A0A6G4WNX7_9HYPH|nr:3'(2'),5'-bisphosphate nucleotidase CysQ [Mesorhizobium camelthorni]NGO55906.1 3'(2'),5'-bisphosphate nucleotidase CysQ [Mesorhizobium camelthorni]